jgi:hypothetical protein
MPALVVQSMVVHRRNWKESIPVAFERARSAKGDELRPRDVVDVLTLDLPNVQRCQIAENVSKYLRRDREGIYRLSRPGRVLRFRQERGDSPIPERSALAEEEILSEIYRIRRTTMWKKMVEEADFIDVLQSPAKSDESG